MSTRQRLFAYEYTDTSKRLSIVDTSDLDLLVDVERGHGYFDMAGFALAVEDELGVFTQLATVNGLKERIRDEVLREAVPL